MDFEDVDRFQFEKSSKIIDRDKENSFIRISEELNKELEILANEEDRKKTEYY